MATVVERAAGTRQAPPAGTRPTAGAGTLIRLILRRDRVRLPIWVGAITLFNIMTANNYPEIYQTAADRQTRAEFVGAPGTRMITGPGYGLEDYTFGAMMGHETLSTMTIFVALMSILLMVRHTRAEEETGRAELIRSSVAGRHAHTVAALVVVCGASVTLGVLTALGLGAVGVEGITWAGSWLYGAALAAIGVVLAAVTAVAAQLTEHARAAGGIAGAFLGLGYLLRGAGNAGEIGGSPLSWLSPLGWPQQTRVYVDDRWWPLLLSVAFATGLIVLAFWLSSRRDIGAGVLPPRPGAAQASAWLSSPLGLAWRQHRTSVMWWSFGLLLFGLVYGAITSETERFVEESSAMENWMAEIGGEILDAALAVLVLMMAVGVAVFAVLAVLRPRAEETAGRAEPVLATAASRTRWVVGHLAIALAGTVAILALSGLSLGITAAAALEDASVIPRVLGAAVAYTPAVWLTVGLGVALFGLVPRASVAVWLVVAYAGVIAILEAPLGLPDGAANLSPFTHVPTLPAEEMSWGPMLILTAIAAGLMVAGLAGFRRRDLETK
jgi:ABC-2 type transport system permease protein